VVGEQADLHRFLIELGVGKALRSVVDERADDTRALISSDLPGSRCPRVEAPVWAFGDRPRREANASLGFGQLGVQGEVDLGQLGQPIEQPLKLAIREMAKLPRRLPGSVSEEGTGKALPTRATPDVAAALRLAAGATRTAFVAPNLRHGRIVATAPVGTPPHRQRLPLELTDRSTSSPQRRRSAKSTCRATTSSPRPHRP
jgi:hypothetical protein